MKRIYRVPKDRGALVYIASLVLKLLVKHGWPAKVQLVPSGWGEGFEVLHVDTGDQFRDDFADAICVAARVVARNYSLEFDLRGRGLVMLMKRYWVSPSGVVKEVEMILQGKSKTPVTEVILHCAAIKTGQFSQMNPFQMFSEVNRWHLERGFKNGFGYHGLITPDGIWYKGRPLEMIGAHCIDHNVGTLGFLLIESRQILNIGTFADYFTKKQAQTVHGLLADLARKGVVKVSGHNDYAPKLCPGFSVVSTDWLP